MDQHPDIAAIEHVFQAWDDALGAKDLDASMALYQPDATLESPLVCHLLGTDEGVVRGSEALRRFVEQVFAHQPSQRRRFRTGFLTDGDRVTWEYPASLLTAIRWTSSKSWRSATASSPTTACTGAGSA